MVQMLNGDELNVEADREDILEDKNLLQIVEWKGTFEYNASKMRQYCLQEIKTPGVKIDIIGMCRGCGGVGGVARTWQRLKITFQD